MRARSRAGGREGFTLLEVMVALAIGALVLLGARLMMGQMADGAERVAAESAEADREANAERVLRDVVSRVETSPDDERGVWGDGTGVRFSTWCEVPAGWLERCTASLGVIPLDGRNVLALQLPHGEVHAVRSGFARARILYLADAGNGGAWVRNWSSTLSAPLAIGVVADADTLILRIGERG